MNRTGKMTLFLREFLFCLSALFSTHQTAERERAAVRAGNRPASMRFFIVTDIERGMRARAHAVLVLFCNRCRRRNAPVATTMDRPDRSGKMMEIRAIPRYNFAARRCKSRPEWRGATTTRSRGSRRAVSWRLSVRNTRLAAPSTSKRTNGQTNKQTNKQTNAAAPRKEEGNFREGKITKAEGCACNVVVHEVSAINKSPPPPPRGRASRLGNNGYCRRPFLRQGFSSYNAETLA